MKSHQTIDIIPAYDKQYLDIVRELFVEYEHSLGFPLCFQNFDKELEELPGEYSPPSGALYIAMSASNAVGCVAMRQIDENNCEMKRLYVRPTGRGKGAGRLLVNTIIEGAVKSGYKKMRLDTVPFMKEAIQLYRKFGFKQIPPYRYNPIAGALYMELDLQDTLRRIGS